MRTTRSPASRTVRQGWSAPPRLQSRHETVRPALAIAPAATRSAADAARGVGRWPCRTRGRPPGDLPPAPVRRRARGRYTRRRTPSGRGSASWRATGNARTRTRARIVARLGNLATLAHGRRADVTTFTPVALAVTMSKCVHRAARHLDSRPECRISSTSNELTPQHDGRSLRATFQRGFGHRGPPGRGTPWVNKGFRLQQASSRHSWRVEALYARADELVGACLPALVILLPSHGPRAGVDHRQRQGHVRGGAARRDGRSGQPSAHREGPDGGHRQQRSLSDHRSASGHIHRHVHAARVQHVQA